MANLTGTSAIVTGGASGLGRATAQVLAADGAAVLIADINAERAFAAADDLTQRGYAAIGFGADVGQEDRIRDMVAQAVKSFGRLDILHSNAALTSADVIGRDLELADHDPALFERVLRVNVVGYALGAKYAIPQMISQGGDVIIKVDGGLTAHFPTYADDLTPQGAAVS